MRKIIREVGEIEDGIELPKSMSIFDLIRLLTEIQITNVPETLPSFLTVSEIMRLTTLRHSSVYSLMNAGKFKTVKLGSKILITTDSYTAWFKEIVSNGGGEIPPFERRK